MAARLGDNSYGKSRVRLFRVTRDGERHDVSDLTVDVAFDGRFEAVHLEGDNAAVLPTDTMRNTVYARHGKQFKSAMLQQYFDNMEWYTADPSFVESKLTKTDITNIRLIKSVENSLGGPMSDDEQRAEDNMSGS